MRGKWRPYLAGLLTAFLLCGLIGTASASVGKVTQELEYRNIRVSLDGEVLDLRNAVGDPVEPFMFGGTNYLPVRALAEALGLNVEWDGSTSTVVLTTPKPEREPTITVKNNATFDATINSEMELRPVYAANEIAYVGKSGPLSFGLWTILIQRFTIKDADVAYLLDAEVGEEYTLVSLVMVFENTSDDEIHFSPRTDMTLVTNQKEQVDTSMWLTQDFDSSYKGRVQQTGNVHFLLKNSPANEITSLELWMDAPTDTHYHSAGEDMRIKINLER